MNISNLINQKFGRLTVIERAANLKSGSTMSVAWVCDCDCGNKTIVRSQCLKTGKTQSCGCYKKEMTIKRSTTHGLNYHPLCSVWRSLRKRCGIIGGATKHEKRDYIDRGIGVCEEWQTNFISFFNWAIENKYELGLDIDREDNNGDYTPDNCRFVTRKKNCQNTRQSKIWVVDGVAYNSLNDASDSTGFHRITIQGWCDGRKSGKYYYPPKKNCYSIKVY